MEALAWMMMVAVLSSRISLRSGVGSWVSSSIRTESVSLEIRNCRSSFSRFKRPGREERMKALRVHSATAGDTGASAGLGRAGARGRLMGPAPLLVLRKSLFNGTSFLTSWGVNDPIFNKRKAPKLPRPLSHPTESLETLL